MARSKFFARRLVLTGAIIGLVAVIAFGLKSQIRSAFEALAGNDFGGPGHSSVSFKVSEGESGSQIITDLVDKGVVKSYRFTMRLAGAGNVTVLPRSSFTLTGAAISKPENPISATIKALRQRI